MTAHLIAPWLFFSKLLPELILYCYNSLINRSQKGVEKYAYGSSNSLSSSRVLRYWSARSTANIKQGTKKNKHQPKLNQKPFWGNKWINIHNNRKISSFYTNPVWVVMNCLYINDIMRQYKLIEIALVYKCYNEVSPSSL